MDLLFLTNLFRKKEEIFYELEDGEKGKTGSKDTEIEFSKIDYQRKKLLKYIKNEEDVDILIRLGHELSSEEYEYFIAYVFEKLMGYKTFVVGGYDDKGIDVKGAKLVNGEFEYIAIQCKRWNVFNVKQKNIKEFYGSVANIQKKHNAKLYFATTNYLTQNAKKFTDEDGVGITYLDYNTMIGIYKMIDWNDFLIYLEKNLNEKEKLGRINKKNIIKEKISTNKDLFSLLKEVRIRLARENHIKAYYIFNDETLKKISMIKPTNKSQFLKIKGVGPMKFDTYGNEFLKAVNNYANHGGAE